MAADKKLKLRISRGLGDKKKPAGLVPSWVQIPPPAKHFVNLTRSSINE
jgi:hypothetical protein